MDRNIRIAGRIGHIIQEAQEISGQPPKEDGTMVFKKESSIRSGFNPFRFDHVTDKYGQEHNLGGTAYVTWLDSPEAFAGDKNEHAFIANRLRHVWRNSLGVMLTAIPEQDAYALTWHHGAGKIQHGYDRPDAQSFGWSEYGPGARHLLGGFMAFHEVAIEEYLTELEDKSSANDLSTDEKADLLFLAASIMVAEKAYAMTTKWAMIDARIQRINEKTGMQIATTDLGGGKTIGLHKYVPDNENDPRYSTGMASKIALARAVGFAAKKTGLYISGGDQNMDAGMTDIVAAVAPNHMAGSKEANWQLRGDYPSDHTGAGIARNIAVFLDNIIKDADAPILLVGHGGVGKGVVKRFIKEEIPRSIMGVVDSKLGALIQARNDLTKHQELFGAIEGMAFILNLEDSTLTDDEMGDLVQKAKAQGFLVVYTLAEAISAACIMSDYRNISVLSPNANPHQLTQEVINTMVSYRDRYQQAPQAVIGGANNMHAIDATGSYLRVAHAALESNILVAADSRANGMGANAVMYNGIGGNDPKVDEALVREIGRELRAQDFTAFELDQIPQEEAERAAKLAWNERVKNGTAIGGFFDDVVDWQSAGGSGNGDTEVLLPPPSQPSIFDDGILLDDERVDPRETFETENPADTGVAAFVGSTIMSAASMPIVTFGSIK